MNRCLLTALLVLVGARVSCAETITVCASGCDYTSINAAIAVANDGDVIQLAAQSYSEGSTVDTNGKVITIRGVVDQKGRPVTYLDGGGAHRVVECTNGETGSTVFENLMIRNGRAVRGGGMHNYGSSPTLRNCSLGYNLAAAAGGK